MILQQAKILAATSQQPKQIRPTTKVLTAAKSSRIKSSTLLSYQSKSRILLPWVQLLKPHSSHPSVLNAPVTNSPLAFNSVGWLIAATFCSRKRHWDATLSAQHLSPNRN